MTNDEIEAALQLIQLISSSDSPRDTTVNHKLIRIPELSKNTGTSRGASYGKFKLEEESEDDSASVAYVSSSSPTSIQKILEKQSRSSGERKRKLLLSSTRAQIQKEANAAQQLLQISEESSCGNISGTSYITDASSAPAAGEKRHDQERESSEAKRGRSKSGSRGFACVMEEEDSMEEYLADIFCRRRRRKRKFRSLIDIYAKTEPLNAVDF